MSFKFFNDTQYKKVKIPYITYIECEERGDENIYWTKNYKHDGYGQYEFFMFLKIEDKRQFTLLDNHVIVCYHCLKTYDYTEKCGNCKKFNFEKNFKNFKNVLKQLIYPKIFWDKFLKTDYTSKYKYYRELKGYINRVFEKDTIAWYLAFHKGMPAHFIVMTKEEVSILYPQAKTWYDVENYM